MIKPVELPRVIIVRPNALSSVKEVCDQLKLGGRPSIITGERTYFVAGRRVAKELSEMDPLIIKVPSISKEMIDEAIRESMGSGFVVGVGGGRCIDVAKYVSTKLGIPCISIPTAASHDGISSPRASVRRGGRGASIGARTPIAVIADTKIIASSPARLTISGCGDVIANLSAVMDWRLAHRLRGEYFNERAAALSEMSAETIIRNSGNIDPASEDSVKIVVNSLIASGIAMCMAGSSRPASGAEHKFSHALDRIADSPALHGEQCGVGAIMAMYAHRADWRRVRDALRAMKAPTTADELGISEKELIQALVQAKRIRTDRYTIFDDVGERKAREIARRTGVI